MKMFVGFLFSFDMLHISRTIISLNCALRKGTLLIFFVCGFTVSSRNALYRQ